MSRPAPALGFAPSLLGLRLGRLHLDLLGLRRRLSLGLRRLFLLLAVLLLRLRPAVGRGRLGRRFVAGRGLLSAPLAATLAALFVPPVWSNLPLLLGILTPRPLAALRRRLGRLRRRPQRHLLLLLIHDVLEQRGNLKVAFARTRSLRSLASFQRLLRGHRRHRRALHLRLQVLHELDVRRVALDGLLALIAVCLAARGLLVRRVLDPRAPLLHPFGHVVSAGNHRRSGRPILLRIVISGFALVRLRLLLVRAREMTRAEDPPAEGAAKVEQRRLVHELDPRDGRHRRPLLPRPERVVHVPVSTREPFRLQGVEKDGLREVRGEVAADRLGAPGRHR